MAGGGAGVSRRGKSWAGEEQEGGQEGEQGVRTTLPRDLYLQSRSLSSHFVPPRCPSAIVRSYERLRKYFHLFLTSHSHVCIFFSILISTRDRERKCCWYMQDL